MTTEQYLFVHIPKTAGTSFRLALEIAFPGRIVYDYTPSAPETSPIVREHMYDKPNIDALKKALADQNALLLGGHLPYLRYKEIFSPTRVITFLREPVARVVSQYHHAVRHGDFTGGLLEFAVVPHNRNLQARLLSGVVLDAAAFVGITERYGDSLHVLARRLGWHLPELRKNVNPKRTELAGEYAVTSDDDAQIRALNEQDVDLYRAACNLAERW